MYYKEVEQYTSHEQCIVLKEVENIHHMSNVFNI